MAEFIIPSIYKSYLIETWYLAGMVGIKFLLVPLRWGRYPYRRHVIPAVPANHLTLAYVNGSRSHFKGPRSGFKLWGSVPYSLALARALDGLRMAFGLMAG